jgi:hypothetical protein
MGRLLEETDARARLYRGAEGVLRQAVEGRKVGTDARDSVHRSLRSLCRVARGHGIQAEQLLVICKDAWRGLPEARGLAPETGRQLLRGVIAQCIEQFYLTDEALADSSMSQSTAPPASSLSFMLGPLS